MDRVDTDMSIETATKVVEHAMQSTSPYVNRVPGGEPTINFDVIKHIVTYSRELNKTMGKELDHSS